MTAKESIGNKDRLNRGRVDRNSTVKNFLGLVNAPAA